MMKGESMIIYVIFSMNEQQQQQSDIYTYTIECAYISDFLLYTVGRTNYDHFLGGGVLISTYLVYYKYIFI